MDHKNDEKNKDIEEYDSWTKVLDIKKVVARKKVDKSFVNIGGSGIPKGMYDAFPTIGKLNEDTYKVNIELLYQGQSYQGYILKKKSGRVWINIKDDKIRKQLQYIFNRTMEYIVEKEPYVETTKKFVIVPDDRAEYVEFSATQIEDVYEMRFLIQGDKDMQSNEELNIDKPDITHINTYLKSKGFNYTPQSLSNFYLSLKSKPFVILSGISGTGKSKLVRLLAESISADFTLIPVRPDWSDATELLGYKDINQVFHPGKLTEVISKAIKNPGTPHVVCLDEMNLARVEYYFSDFLSLIESRHWENQSIMTDTLPIKLADDDKPLYIPDNLYIVGTVNMDETTFQFSKKVLDRANTIELNDIDLTYDFNEEDIEVNAIPIHNLAIRSQYLVLKDCKAHGEFVKDIISDLIEINNILTPANMQFAYRVRDEVIFYMTYNEEYKLMSRDEAFDYQFLQKILPRINGTSNRTHEVLVNLFWYCVDGNIVNRADYDIEKWSEQIPHAKYQKSCIKLLEMLRRFDEDGFTSFWF